MINKKVLIVDDDRWLAEQQVRTLTRAGFKTAVSPHALAAIEDIDNFKPDVIVLDVLLPGNTGFGLMHELQSHSDISQIPIILCTSLAADVSIENLRPYGVRRLLDKSTMQPDDIVAAVRSVLL